MGCKAMENIKITEFRPHSRNTLQGFTTILFEDIGLLLRDVAFHEKNGSNWFQLPAKPYDKPDGTRGWNYIVAFLDKDKFKQFQEIALKAFDRFQRDTKEEQKNGDNKQNELKKMALAYQQAGYSPIPVRPNKRPYIKWEKFQQEGATEKQIVAWWDKWPGANIGVCTGPVSGFDVVDIDTQEGEDHFITNLESPSELVCPSSRTPSGGRHIYVKATGEGNSTGFLPGVDYRGKGGYIVAPPSVGQNGKEYAFDKGNSIFEVDLPQLPLTIKKLIKNIPTNKTQENSQTGGKVILSVPAGPISLDNFATRIPIHHRDHFIFHAVNQLQKSNTPQNIIRYLANLIGAKGTNPPFPPNEVQDKINSAFKRREKRTGTLAHEIKDYLNTIEGSFRTRDLYGDLKLLNPREKENARKILNRLKGQLIEPHGDQAGHWRIIDDDLQAMDLENTQVETVDLILPFNIHEFVVFMPGNIILVAGDMNSGKTAFLLNIAKDNLQHSKIYYFNCEMGPSEMRGRLNLFNDFPIGHKNFKAYERGTDFADVIRPGKGKVNIIDYLELTDDFWKVGGLIKDIHQKLDGALCVIALQKKHPKVDDPLGGKRSLEKPRLALSMANGHLKILKAKNWKKPAYNPNGREIDFKLVQGCKFIPVGGWR